MEPHTIPYVREVVIFLMTAAIVAPVFHRLRISPVVGYLLVGVIIGPYGLGLFVGDIGWLSNLIITDVEGVATLAELGVIFLLFVIGLELSLDRLWSMRRLVFGLGATQVIVSGAVIGLVAWWWGNAAQLSILLGASLALSSTAIVMQLLVESGRLGSRTGRTAFSILLFQDLAVVPILFMVGVFTMDSAGSPALGFLSALGKAAVAITIILLVGRTALRWLFRLAASTRSAEMFMAAILLVVIGTATAAAAAGLSMALGAFLAGLLLAETEYRHQVEVDIEPFKGLLMALFFVSVGMGIDVRVLGENGFWILASVGGLIALKTVLITALCKAFRLPWSISVEAGILLSQGGEFAFIVVGAALAANVIAPDIAQFMLIVTGLTMFVTPGLAVAARRAGAFIEAREAAQPAAPNKELDELEDHVIIAGFGRVGRRIARILDHEGFQYVAIDNDPARVSEYRGKGKMIMFGDASRPQMMHQTRIKNAAALAVTMNDPVGAERVVESVRSQWPDLPIFARARDAEHARKLLDLGATDVVPETVEASLQLGGRVLQQIGLPDEAWGRRIESERETELDEIRS